MLVGWHRSLASPPKKFWQAIHGQRSASIFLETWYQGLNSLAGDKLGRDYWNTILEVKTAVNKALEDARIAGTIGGSLEAYCHAVR